MKYRTMMILTAAAAIGFGAWFGWTAGPPVAPQVAAARKDAALTDAQRKELQRRVLHTVRERGTLRSADPGRLSCRLDKPATIIFLVPEGTHAKKGDLLLEFDSSSLKEDVRRRELDVKLAQLAVKRAEANLAGRKLEQSSGVAAAKLAVASAELARESYLAKDGEHKLELKALDGQIAIAKSRIAAAKQLQAQAKSAEERAQAEANLIAAQTFLSVAKGKRTLLTKHTLQRKAAALDAEIAGRKAELVRVQNTTAAVRTSAESELAAARTKLSLQQERLEHARRQLQFSRITAPRDSIVVYANMRSRRSEPVTIEEGAQVRPRQPVLMLPDLKHLQVRVLVHETGIARVKKGQPVKLRFDGVPDKVFRGTVQSIAKNPRQGDWPNTDVTLFEVVVSVDETSPVLKLGMSAEAEIDVSQKR